MASPWGCACWWWGRASATISGKWGYLEHDWVATAGDWIYEAPGEAHTLVAYESPGADARDLQRSPGR